MIFRKNDLFKIFFFFWKGLIQELYNRTLVKYDYFMIHISRLEDGVLSWLCFLDSNWFSIMYVEVSDIVLVEMPQYVYFICATRKNYKP